MPAKIWTDEEIELIKEKYPRYGTCCLEHFPGKTKEQLQSKATALGLTSKRRKKGTLTKRRIERYRYEHLRSREKTRATYHGMPSNYVEIE